MIFNINSTRGQTRFLTCVARVTRLVQIIQSNRPPVSQSSLQRCLYKKSMVGLRLRVIVVTYPSRAKRSLGRPIYSLNVTSSQIIASP